MWLPYFCPLLFLKAPELAAGSASPEPQPAPGAGSLAQGLARVLAVAAGQGLGRAAAPRRARALPRVLHQESSGTAKIQGWLSSAVWLHARHLTLGLSLLIPKVGQQQNLLCGAIRRPTGVNRTEALRTVSGTEQGLRCMDLCHTSVTAPRVSTRHTSQHTPDT